MKCRYKECQEDWDDKNPICLCGETNYKICENYIEAHTNNVEGSLIDQNKEHHTLPWSASTMGELDTNVLRIRKPPITLGVIGQSKSGKTTLLACLYMLLRGGKNINGYTFAGSYTLLGWEKIAHFLKLDSNKKLSFPPHTSANMNRVPGLLHIILKDIYGHYQDILFTDAPGEWFSEWGKTVNSDAGRGARWIDENSDAFILVADSQAFKNNTGKARHDLYQVVERMRNTHKERPTSLVWTKTDVKLDKSIKNKITSNIQNALPKTQVYDIAVVNRETEDELVNILQIVSDLLNEKKLVLNSLPVIASKNKDDFFFNIR